MTWLGSRIGVGGGRGGLSWCFSAWEGFVGGGCHDDVMSSTASAGAVVVSPCERLEVLFEELAELTGQRNAIDGRIVEIVGEIDRDELWGATGARSVPALVAWRTGCSSGNAYT